MRLKQYYDYRMDFKSKWATASGIFMGIAFFIRVFYYFGLENFGQCSSDELAASLVMPLLLCGVYILFLNGIKLNVPLFYGILGAVIYLMVMVSNFHTGNMQRIVLSGIGYILTSVILIATAEGYLPDKIFIILAGSLIVVLRFFLYELDGYLAADGLVGIITHISQQILQVSSMSILLALFCLPMCFKSVSNPE